MTPTTKTTNLTPARTDLIGRDLEIARLREMLGAGRLVTVMAIGGSGKTRLAREFGHQVVPDFPGGVWMVELANFDGLDAAMRELAQMLGLGFHGAAASVRTIVEALRNKPRTLLIFDNLEHLVDEIADPIARILDGAHDVCVLTTSREPLRIAGEQRFKLTPLSQQAAVALFARRAAEVIPTFVVDDSNRSSITELVDHLDRLPLAIELAASRVSVLPPAQLMQRITQTMSALKARERDRPARHETLSAALEWSWDLLTEEQRRGLAQCAAFRGGFTMPAFRAVVSSEGPHEDLIEDLIERSLVEFEDDARGRRFFLFEVVRGAADTKLAASGRSADVNARHADFYVSLLDETPASRIHERHAELPNLLAALRREHDPNKRSQVAVAAARLLRLTGSVGLLEETFSELLAYSAEGELAPRLLLFRAIAALERNEYAEVARDCDRCVALATSRTEPVIAAEALTVLGLGLAQQGRRVEAEAALRRGLSLAADSPRIESEVLASLALVALEDGRPGEAEPLYEQSLRQSRVANDEVLIGRALTHLGTCQARQGRAQEAITHLEEALLHHDRVGDDRHRGQTYLALGEARALARDSEGAAEALLMARDIAHALGHREWETDALIGLGELRRGPGDRTYLVQAVELNEGSARLTEEVRARCHLVVNDLLELRHELVRPAIRRVLGLLADRDPVWSGLMWGYLAVSYAATLDAENARSAVQQAMTMWDAAEADLRYGAQTFSDAVLVLCAGNGAAPAQVSTLRRWLQTEGAARLHLSGWPRHDARLVLRGLLESIYGSESSKTLSVSRDGRRYVPPEEGEVDFSRRGPLRKILVALTEAREATPGVGLSADDVLEAGWPGDKVTVDAGAARVYSAIRTLRKNGLEDVLLTQDDGYLIDPQIAVAWLD